MVTETNESKTRGLKVDDNSQITMLPLLKQVFLFLGGWLIIQSIATIVRTFFLFIFKVPNDTESIKAFFSKISSQMGLNASVYIILLFVLIAIVNKDIPQLFKSFKKWTPYFAGVLCFLAIITFNNVWSIISNQFYHVTDNINESNIISIKSAYPFYSLIIFGLVGPVCEELTYRVGLYSLVRRQNKILAYVVVSLVFAFIHFNISGSDLINELLNLPTYIFAGLAFSFTYEKYGLAGSLTAHVVNNVLALVLTRIY